MKKLLLLATLIPGLAFAQQTYQKTVICSETKIVFEMLRSKEYNEKPIWIGRDERQINFSLFVNPKTQSWTIVEFKGPVTCIIAAGDTGLISPESQRL